MSREQWQCPYCNQHATIKAGIDVHALNFSGDALGNVYPLVGGKHYLSVRSVICPNADCEELSLTVGLGELSSPKPDQAWHLCPESNAKPFPSYIPEPIRKNYREACLIRDKSPNAAATLARRCLQGMVRNFHNIKQGRNLKEEFDNIKGKPEVTATVWKAIDEVRKMGAIGGHMEADVNLIVDVEEGEAKQLIWLIEYLFEIWYIRRHDEEMKLKEIAGMSENKKQKPANQPDKDKEGKDGGSR